MPPKKLRARRAREGTERSTGQEEVQDRIYALIAKAEAFYRQGRYRRAMAVCDELALLDPENMIAEQMRDGCLRIIRRRRSILLGTLVTVLLSGLGIVAIYVHLLRVRIEPAPGVVQLRERQKQTFRFASPLGQHRSYEYTWSLLDADGGAVPAVEQGSLVPEQDAPWVCSYEPRYDLVKGAAGGQPVRRRVVAAGMGPRGQEFLRAEWVIEVADCPSSPAVLSVEPPSQDLLGIVAGGEGRRFSLEAEDGDGGDAVVYEWLLGDLAGVQAGEPQWESQTVEKGPAHSWTYRPGPEVLARHKDKLDAQGRLPQQVVCQVSNRAGEPLPKQVVWDIRVVRSNAPPQLIAFEPPLGDLVRIKEGGKRKCTAKVYDPDEGDLLRWRWELDGAVVSRRDTCVIQFPLTTTDNEKLVTLKFTVADLCGAKIEHTWRLVVVNVREDAVTPELGPEP